MSREQAFDEMMESLFEMARFISVYEATPRRYRMQELYMTEVHALNQIWQRSSTNMTQLAQLSNRTKGAVSQMIAKLEKRGLVEKRVSPANKSEVLLYLTPDGEEICRYHRDLEKRIYTLYLEGMDDFSEQDFVRYRQLLSRIRQITVDKSTT